MGITDAINVHISNQKSWDLETDLLVVGCFEGQPLEGSLKELDVRLKGALAEAATRGSCSGKWLSQWTTATLGSVPARRVLVLGLGRKEEFSLRRLRVAAGAAAQAALAHHAAALALEVPSHDYDMSDAAEMATDGAIVGSWRFAGYHAKPESGPSVSDLTLLGLGEGAESGIRRGQVVGQAENLVRELGMRPSNKLYPELLAEEAQRVGKEHGFDVEVFDEEKLKELGMGAILGVGSGSVYPPRMVIMRYNGGGRTLALVGKGITFDSGGISLKPPLGMEDMKFDMLGSGAVLGAMAALADLKVPLNVVGIMALAQNMPSGSAYKPGDVVTAFNGKTIEVTNTDAEGRVALSDAVSYAAHLGVDWIVETSTLTGAAITVLGHEATCLVASNDSLASLVLQASETAGERVWRLPIYPEYRDLYRSPVADIKNSPGRDAGTITAGMIIAEFAGDVPYAHLDIAGTAWTDKGPLNRTKNGPTGVMVRTFVKLADMLSR